jgi:integrase
MGRPRITEPVVYDPYREGDGQWRVVARWPDGRRRGQLFPTERAAWRFATDLRKKLSGQASLTLEQLLTRYETYLTTTKGLKPQTIATQKKAIRRFWGELSLRASQLTPERAVARYQALVAEGLAAATHREDLSSARRMCAWLVEADVLDGNPTAGIKGQGKVKRGKPQLTLDESRKFAALALERAQEGDEGALAALTCLLLGVRRGELVGLTARSLDDGGRLLRIFESKTDTGKRPIEIPEVLQPLLQKQAEGKKSLDRLFPHPGLWVWRATKKICADAGVSVEVSPHGLRGGHATLAMEAGMSAHLVAAQLGHASPQMTLDHYAAPGSLERQQAKKVSLRIVR